MSGEDQVKDEVQVIEPDAEGNVKVEKNDKGEFPKVVPASQYIGVKESLGKKAQAAEARATAAEDKAKGLEEKLSKATSTEEVEKLRSDLKDAQDKLQKANEDLTNIQTKTLTEKRDTLVKRGLPEEKVKDMSDKELDAAMLVLGNVKPGADLGGGGGGGEPPAGAKAKMRSGFDTLHPTS